MPHHDDGGCVEWFLKVLVGEDANFGHFAMAEEGTNGWLIRAERESGEEVSQLCVEKYQDGGKKNVAVDGDKGRQETSAIL